MGLPPLAAGAVKLTVAWALPAVAAPMAGAPGAVVVTVRAIFPLAPVMVTGFAAAVISDALGVLPRVMVPIAVAETVNVTEKTCPSGILYGKPVAGLTCDLVRPMRYRPGDTTFPLNAQLTAPEAGLPTGFDSFAGSYAISIPTAEIFPALPDSVAVTVTVCPGVIPATAPKSSAAPAANAGDGAMAVYTTSKNNITLLNSTKTSLHLLLQFRCFRKAT